MAKSLKNHIGDADLTDIHKKRTVKGAPEQGACLWGHEGKYREEHPCSYRWQAHKAAKQREGNAGFKSQVGRTFIYDYRPDPAASGSAQRLKTSAYKPTAKPGDSTASARHPADYITEINPPELVQDDQGQWQGDWDLDGPARDLAQDRQRNDGAGQDQVTAKSNFRDCRHPYWHNAHHIIPKALLVNLIDEIAGNSEVAKLMKRTLMGGTDGEDEAASKAKRYNVNHGHNLIILPMDAEVAGLLKLPRHLRLKDPMVLPPGMTAEEAIGYIEEHIECMSHEDYDGVVKEKIKDFIDKFSEQAKAKLESGSLCESTGSPDTIKSDLEKASGKLLLAILKFGETTEIVNERVYGRAISDMKDSIGE